MNRFTRLVSVASLVLGALACTVERAPESIEATDTALRAPLASEIVGTIAYGQTVGPIAYTETPRYRALTFNGRDGDVARVTVGSPDVAEVWLLGTDSSTLSHARASHLGANVVLDQPLKATGTFTIVMREADQEDTEFTVGLERAGCATTNGCGNPPAPATWRNALPAGALDLSARLSVPITHGAEKFGGKVRSAVPLRLTGSKTGEVKLTFTSGSIGSRTPGDEATVKVPPDGSFAVHLDFTYFGSHIIEYVVGSLLDTGEVAVTSFAYRNFANGADLTFSGREVAPWSNDPVPVVPVPPTDASWRTGLPAGALNVWSEVSIPATCTTTSGSRTLTQFGTRATVHLTGNAQGTIMVTVQSPGLEGSAAFDDTGRAAVSANGDNPHSTSYLRANVRLGAGREIVINSYEQGYSGASDSAGCTQTGEARARF